MDRRSVGVGARDDAEDPHAEEETPADRSVEGQPYLPDANGRAIEISIGCCGGD